MAKIYQLSEKEVHMVGDVVGVVWRTETKTKQITGEDGLKYRAEVPVRDGEPYISFFNIREDRDGEFYEHDDSPVDGGISAEYAKKVADELLLAIEYLKTVS